MLITSQIASQTAHDVRRGQLTKQAQVFVSQTFFGTMLKQMRNSPFRSELFGGGRGGEAFGSLFDQHLADRMARGAAGSLVRSVVRKLEKRADQNVPAAELTNDPGIQFNQAVKSHVAPTVRT